MNYTPKQLQILRLIYTYQNGNGYSPTYAELAKELGVSTITVFEHLEALERKGAIRRRRHEARSVEIVEPNFLREQTSRKHLPVQGYFSAGKALVAIEAHEEVCLGEFFSGSAQSFVLKVRGDAMAEEHILDGDQELRDVDGARKIFFEPRNAPMEFKKLSDAEAELHQEPTPTFHLESRTRFKLVEPHYLDMSFRCKPTQHAFAHGYIGLFWASYINAPDDKSIYFRNAKLWQQLCTQRHNDESTVRHRDDKLDLRFSDGFPNCLFRNYSPLRYDVPFYYGHFREQTAIFMFDRTSGIRFTHSPSGGGANPQRQTTNPAWDFQYLLPNYEVNKEYGFRARVVYRERCDREEVLREYAAWRKKQ